MTTRLLLFRLHLMHYVLCLCRRHYLQFKLYLILPIALNKHVFEVAHTCRLHTEKPYRSRIFHQYHYRFYSTKTYAKPFVQFSHWLLNDGRTREEEEEGEEQQRREKGAM